MASSSFNKSPPLGYREVLNELARSQKEVSERLRSLLRLSPVDGEAAEQSFVAFSDESTATAIVVVPLRSNGKNGRHKKRRKKLHSWTTTFTSCAPYDDGFQWRKYGEKKISKSKFTRSYFRCAYRDEQGCSAKKQVQQMEMEDPPIFHVTCSNEHTCDYLSSLFLTELNMDY